jgi:hypothetical protein
MPRRPLHVLSLVSAVVCVLSLVVVGRSFVRSDVVFVPIGHDSTCYFVSVHGQMALAHVRAYRDFKYASVDTANVRPAIDRVWQNLAGIRWLGIGWGYRMVVLPLWLVPVVTAVLPVRWWVIRRRAGGGRGFAVEVAGESAVGTEGAGESE